MCGSSPRGRGKPRPRGWGKSPFRLIPARAGKTRGAVNDALAPAAHPRAGGENSLPWFRVSGRSGSSPRGRGKHLAACVLRGRQRLIPARAGKTVFNASEATNGPAHPRAGGENNGRSCRITNCYGSSPRGRGKPRRHNARSAPFGLIPARAGKTPRDGLRCADAQAHPRAGGENQLIDEIVRSDQGSSPRGRGKPLTAIVPRGTTGLIPARAGKTMTIGMSPSSTRAHPRAGGENWVLIEAFAISVGSSPRGRGKQTVRILSISGDRLIPARAGKTTRMCARARPPWAHPRAGGENFNGVPPFRGGPGSSPRGRGKRERPAECSACTGLIPARAGKTTCGRAPRSA